MLPAPTKVSAIRQRVAAAIAEAMGSDGWRESKETWDTFGTATGGDGDGRQHKGYAVGVPSSRVIGGRQATREGSYVETTVGVRWAYKIAAKAKVESYDAGVDVENAIIAAVNGIRDLDLLLADSDRPVDDQGWMLGDTTFTVKHWLPLQISP